MCGHVREVRRILYDGVESDMAHGTWLPLASSNHMEYVLNA